MREVLNRQMLALQAQGRTHISVGKTLSDAKSSGLTASMSRESDGWENRAGYAAKAMSVQCSIIGVDGIER